MHTVTRSLLALLLVRLFSLRTSISHSICGDMRDARLMKITYDSDGMPIFSTPWLP
jgi:hypothetical protein